MEYADVMLGNDAAAKRLRVFSASAPIMLANRKESIMATQGDTFARKEKKYLITAEQCAAIKRGLAGHMRLDDYGATRIDSLYLDTPDHALIARSLEKPLYKEKLRIRSYGAFSSADTVFVEIKKKYKGIVYKRRVRMSAKASQAYLDGATYEEAQQAYPVDPEKPDKDLAPGKVQIAREIDAFFSRHEGLKPAMLISCLREAWCKIDPEDEDCVDRITFDEDISYIDLFETSSVKRRPVTSGGQVVMEIKCAGGYPLWLCDLLASCGAYPRSFSKYGNAYKRTLADRGDISVRQTESGKLVVDRVPTSRERQEQTRVPDILLGFVKHLFGRKEGQPA